MLFPTWAKDRQMNIWQMFHYWHYVLEEEVLRKVTINQKYTHDPELKQHMEDHEEYERKLADWNRRLYLTPEEEVEKKRIQKLKLAGRDRIEVILAKYRSQGVRG
jgi:hypothetical protein